MHKKLNTTSLFFKLRQRTSNEMISTTHWSYFIPKCDQSTGKMVSQKSSTLHQHLLLLILSIGWPTRKTCEAYPTAISRNLSYFYKVLFVGRVRFNVSNGDVLDDGCVAFEDQDGTLQAGFIRTIERRLGIAMNAIIHVEQFDIQKNHCLDLPTIDPSSPITIHCADFIHARLSGKKQSFPANKLIEKLAYIQTNERIYIIMRYTNLNESSWTDHSRHIIRFY